MLRQDICVLDILQSPVKRLQIMFLFHQEMFIVCVFVCARVCVCVCVVVAIIATAPAFVLFFGWLYLVLKATTGLSQIH